MAKKATTVVVLNDGETYTNIEGCMILELTAAGLDRLESTGVEGLYVPDPDGVDTLVFNSKWVKRSREVK